MDFRARRREREIEGDEVNCQLGVSRKIVVENRESRVLKTGRKKLLVDAARAREHLDRSLAVAAALVPEIGYEKAQAAVAKATADGITLREALTALGVDVAVIDAALSASRLRRLGTS